VKKIFLEAGQTVRWRSRRWRVIEEERNGFVKLLGLDAANRNSVVTPLVALEGDALVADALPLPDLNVEASDRARWRALHLAYIAAMAGGRDQMVGIDWGAVAVEPYQLVPLLRVSRSIRPRLLIADDTGLGKTAEAGIVLRWLVQRHLATRMLIVTRATPEPGRWRGEMWTKFGFDFDILKSGADFADRRRRSPTVNVFAQSNRLIISMTLAAQQIFLDELRACPAPFDVVVVDEAHHLAERGSRVKRLALLGRQLARACKDGTLLLLTATPHDGKTESFLSLLRLLDPLVEFDGGRVPVDVASRLVVRRLKSEVTLAGGRKFQQRRIHVISTLGHATKEEKAIDAPLDAYLAWLTDRQANLEAEGRRAQAKGCEFLAGVLRKRFGSSVAALRATLRRRLDLPPAAEDEDDTAAYVDNDDPDPEDQMLDPGIGADAAPPETTTIEADLAHTLLQVAERVPPGMDSKLQAMIRLLHQTIPPDEKVVIFTEYRDTLRAAARRLTQEGHGFVSFHGETPDADRERALAAFSRDPDVRIFLATDAASEGKNLQHAAHHLIHLDVPWNPNRYEQRNGRIDRYGQDRVPQIWALVAADRKRGEGRPEYRALELIVEKLRTIADQLGSVNSVLPGYAVGSVRDVLLNADRDVERQLEGILDDPSLQQARDDLSRLTVHNQREIKEAQGLVDRLGTTDDFEHELGGLLTSAFRGWDDGGSLEALEPGLVRVNVPARLRAELGRAVIPRATFRRDMALSYTDAEEALVPEFLSPGHPFVGAVLQALRDESTDPAFPHRFDVAADPIEGLILSFALRFVDAEGRTVAEMLEAVEVALDGEASEDYEANLGRLGLNEKVTRRRPDPSRIEAWRQRYPVLVEPARTEAARRAEDHRQDLTQFAERLREEQVEVLALWKGEQAKKVEFMTFGLSAQATLEAAQRYDDELGRLEVEYEARKAALRDRSEVRLAALELIGGRLIVRPCP
jgi:superfamily II DNA or RNA helicase